MDGSAGALEIVSSVRAALAAGTPDGLQAALGGLGVLETTLSRVMAEHSGMADELLRVYEQLGIVFEVTRRLPSIHDEDEVLRLFVESLRPTYPDTNVSTVRNNAAGELVICDHGVVEDPWIRASLSTCRDQRRVIVADGQRDVQGSCPDGQEPGSAQAGAGQAEFGHVMCGPVFAGDTFVCALLLGYDSTGQASPGRRLFDASDMLLLESLSIFCGDMIRNFRLLGELRQLSVDTVRALISAIEQKDEYTSGHSTRVGHFARLLGKQIGLGETDLQFLEWSALLHDIGKIGIRDDVLKKAGRLTDEEFEHIKEHPKRSYDVVCSIPQLQDALDGVVHHHEHWDGSGYPDGLEGPAIPLQARVIQVADIFDALTSTRSYRKAFDWQKALSILCEEAGTTVDPHLIGIFDDLVRRMVEEQPGKLEAIMAIRSDGGDSPVGALVPQHGDSTTGPSTSPTGDA